MADSRDIIKRGVSKTTTPKSPYLFAGLRLLDIPFQYLLISRALPKIVHQLGGFPTPIHNPIVLGLSLHQSIIMTMAIGSALKQTHWAIAISGEAMPTSNAIQIAVFNTVMNSFNTLLYTWSVTSAAKSLAVHLPFLRGQELPLYAVIGSVMYVVGLAIEWYSEIQRREFKKDAVNSGKCFTGGLFSLARHPNYQGYTIWRAGYSLASSGLAWSSFMALFFSYNFLTSSIPMLDGYCSDRYGAAWAKYKEQVPWKLVPGVV